MKILAIGGCGSMGRYAMRSVQNYSTIEEIIIADTDYPLMVIFWNYFESCITPT